MSVQSPVNLLPTTNGFFPDSSVQESPKTLSVTPQADDGRERSQSTGDFERLSLMDSDDEQRESGSVSPPLMNARESRSLSLTPQPTRSVPHYATLGRLRRGKTIDTSSVRKVEHEDYAVVNQYKVLDIIGHGSFGIVHKAKSSEDSETYAMKIVRKRKLIKKGFPMRRPKVAQSPSQPDPLADIRREIAILKKLDHPNVVKLIEVLDDPNEDDLVLVFEYISNGAVMAEITPESRMPEDRARKYFIDLMLGLEYLHSQKVIHRDIKPENLLLDERDKIKIADFGVSEQWASDAEDVQLKKSAGTRAFAAPETLDSSNPVFGGKALDIWAAGVTLYCFVFGKVPFTAPAVVDLYEKIQTQELTIPDDVPVSLELKDILLRLLEKNPNRRITVEQLRGHIWITMDNNNIPSTDENCRGLIDVSEEEIERAVKNYQTPIHILVMLKQMARQKSLRNPYSDSIGNSPTALPRDNRTSKEKRSTFASKKSIPSISISMSENS